jgi:hypothetical protein
MRWIARVRLPTDALQIYLLGQPTQHFFSVFARLFHGNKCGRLLQRRLGWTIVLVRNRNPTFRLSQSPISRIDIIQSYNQSMVKLIKLWDIFLQAKYLLNTAVVILLILWVRDGRNVELLIWKIPDFKSRPRDRLSGWIFSVQENAEIAPQVRYTTTPFYTLPNS